MDEQLIKVGVTHGDINGVGYEVILKTFEDSRITELCTPVIYGSSKVAAYHRKAMDLPPVNFRNIDLLCPKITATEAKTGNNPIPVNAVAKSFASMTGNAPFIASRNITIKNHFFPITLLTFVAPVEPEPIFLISCPVANFTIMYPVGIEPII